MADIIQLLPDAIANQIAAGEVIQRPASVVKELLENAIDAGATSIKLVVKDAGKSLIQVIDDGCGMSETDARMAFERHATSKIRKSEDLFCIRTMGFRGEAMASIAAIAQVEMRTRRHAEELGTRLVIEGSAVKSQEPCQCSRGTTLSVKNLFFNVPARRNFLRSNTVEMRHIVDEFQRIAIANADIFFSLHHNNSEVFHLPAGKLRQRLIGVFGNAANKKLVPVSEETDILTLKGFIGKPEYAKKTRGEQYFFVNNRFIKSAYLNHAVVNAYEDILPKDTHPLYVIFIDIDPAHIDINVHPTKQEIKFDDERLVYNYLKVAVRHSLGQYSIMPSLDFDQDPLFYNTLSSSKKPIERGNTVNSLKGNGHQKQDTSLAGSRRQDNNLDNWQQLYEGLDAFDQDNCCLSCSWRPSGAQVCYPGEHLARR
jgi:DNA mismatch repair protein MutL